MTTFADSGAKDAIRRALPTWYLARRARRHRASLARSFGIEEATRRFVATHGSRVRRGPATGMEYPPAWIAEVDVAVGKLVGSYELELHDALEEALAASPRVIVDIGAAEGYWAVGLARRASSAEVHAFELDPWLRRRCRSLARLNGVNGRLHLHGLCTAERLEGLDLDGAFLLSDCEGAEVEIFPAIPTERLRRTTMLIEMHDEAAGTDVLAVMTGLFGETHRLTRVDPAGPTVGSHPELADLPAEQARVLLSEFRSSPTSWAFLTPLAAA